MAFLSKIAFGNGAHQSARIADFYPVFKYFYVNHRPFFLTSAVFLRDFYN